ncbi:glycosyltransferase [bacterium]|nr:glycosyltransferase [bacterium]
MSNGTHKLISCVIPVFNEEAVLPFLFTVLAGLRIDGYAWEFILVDDGSTDQTLGHCLVKHREDARFKVIQLGRNFGHQTALTAGLEAARGDCAVILDADLQDPPVLIETFVREWENGADVVYGIRQHRKENALKRACYHLFYRVYKKLAAMDVPLDSGDFCLIGRQALDMLNALPERVRFVRGLRSWVGLKQVGIPYERVARVAGESKYTYISLTKLAFDGLVNFSTVPLHVATFLAFFTALGGFGIMGWALYAKFFGYEVPWGWTSTMVVMLFLFSIMFLILAILGQYIGRIFLEVKERPLYTVAHTWGFEPSREDGGKITPPPIKD